MKAPTKKELNAKMIHYRKLAADRAKDINVATSKISELEADINKLKIEIYMANLPTDPWQSQHGGKHYAELTIQPLQYTLGALGYEAFKGACHNHVARYTTRRKDNEVEQLKKARHILELWIFEAEKKLKSKGK